MDQGWKAAGYSPRDLAGWTTNILGKKAEGTWLCATDMAVAAAAGEPVM
jgi:hypothetical protein